MTTPSIPQDSPDRTVCDAPSLFVEEWVERYATTILPMLQLETAAPEVVYLRFRAQHPPLFLGVYTTPGVLQGQQLERLPPLQRRGDQIWLGAWGVEPPHPVSVIPILRHRLAIVVCADRLIVLRESELEQALAAAEPASSAPAGGALLLDDA